jgi:tRNA threonylcarbamoyladenosine biosynthesis protein TsaB
LISLALETSGEIVSLALLAGDQVVAEKSFPHLQQLSRSLMCEVDELLENAGLDATRLGAVAVAVGPGSFTGLRLGVTAAKTLAWARSIPVVGVSTLDCLLADGAASEGELRIAVVSAGAEHVFAVARAEEPAAAGRLSAPCLWAVPELLNELGDRDGPVTILGGGEPFAIAVAELRGDRPTVSRAHLRPTAAAVGRLALPHYRSPVAQAAHPLAPVYLRASAAEARRQDAG